MKLTAMPYKKVGLAILAISCILLTGFAVSVPKAKNLKVQPMISAMKSWTKHNASYNKTLGLCCEFCHEKDKNNASKMICFGRKLPKRSARNMLRMTMDINKKYFDTVTKVHAAY